MRQLMKMEKNPVGGLEAGGTERTDEFGDAYRRRHALGVSSTVNSAKAKLMEDGHVERYDGRYTIADPFFAQYLRMA